MDTIILDVETCAIDNAADYLDPVQPAGNLKDPEKIKADIAQKEEARLEKLALDWNMCRIVAIGMKGYTCTIQKVDESSEAAALRIAWDRLGDSPIVGFCIRTYDLPVMIQRSRYLGVSHPDPNTLLDRYRSTRVIDLFDVLTFRDQPCTSIMRRSLKSFARRFGIPVPDQHDGKDIAKLVKEGAWDSVIEHCRHDLMLTHQLAVKLGVVTMQDAVVATR